MSAQNQIRYASFAKFYPYYLSEHSNRTCRRLHFVGTSLGLAFLLYAFATLTSGGCSRLSSAATPSPGSGTSSSRRTVRRPSRTRSTASWETG